MERLARLSPLGLQRLRLLECLGGNNRSAPGYFSPDTDADVFDEFRRYAMRMSEVWGAESDPSAVSLLAAARVLTGDVTAARVIIDHFPAQPFALDHGAGVCMVAPFYALGAALPLPSTLADTTRWLAGSPDQDALRAWLAAHGGRLRWIEAEGIYQLAAIE